MENLIQALRINVKEKQEMLDKFNDDLVVAKSLLQRALPYIKASLSDEPRALAKEVEDFLMVI